MIRGPVGTEQIGKDPPANLHSLLPGGPDACGGRSDFRCVLASIPSVLHFHVSSPLGDVFVMGPAVVPHDLLASDVKLHVQSVHLLLDEFKVGLSGICGGRFDRKMMVSSFIKRRSTP